MMADLPTRDECLREAAFYLREYSRDWQSGRMGGHWHDAAARHLHRDPHTRNPTEGSTP